MKKRNLRNDGFSLVEAMLAVVVLSIAVAGGLLPFTTGASVQVEGAHRTLAANLATQLTEKIINTPFDDIISNHSSINESPGNMHDNQGNQYVGSRYARFSRDAACMYVYVPEQNHAAAPNFILVNVRLYYDGRELANIKRLISR